MPTATFQSRKQELETYFDRTAVDAWSKLTSDAPVSKIRATVRAGRDEMRNTLLSWLPQDLRGARLLDAGCGTGALSVEAASRGAEVVAVDISPTLVQLGRERLPHHLGEGTIDFRTGDMLSADLGRFDYVVAMDSLIHYRPQDLIAALEKLAERTREGILFTFAPQTPLLTLMHTVGKLFPRSDRAPAIVPVSEAKARRLIGGTGDLAGWQVGRTHRVTSGFYMSQALEIFNTAPGSRTPGTSASERDRGDER
ncbi:MAG: magnesium protoporphyrin IX methyltransferase [Alphaproteobacteria bacterium]|nr:magnesium protoporphyrin IX methyltransferase [Alphaproteobacteria bacterium]